MTGLAANVTSMQACISMKAWLNPSSPNNPVQQAFANSNTPDGFTVAAAAALPQTVATSTTTAFNLATLFAACTAPVFVFILDQSNPGVGFTLTTSDDASGTIGVAPGYWWGYMADGTTALPTVHITNPSATQELVLAMGVLTN